MSMSLNIDKYLLCSMFNISSKKIDDEYAGMSIEQIMEAEAKSGNTAAAKFDNEILSNPTKLIELLELNNPENKYAILSNMNQEDLENMLPSLSDEDLTQGLNYFSKDKLLDLTNSMPQSDLLNYTFGMFSDQHVMSMMPEDQVNNMLCSDDLNTNQAKEAVQTLDPSIMAMMIVGSTEQQQTSGSSNTSSQNSSDSTSDVSSFIVDYGLDGKPKYDTDQMTSQINSMPDSQFQNAMLSIPTANKQEFAYKLASDNPDMYKNVSSETYTDMIGTKKSKQQMISGMSVVSSDQLVKMVSKLPKELTSVVLTQMDTSKFASQLSSSFKDILSKVVAS